MGTGVRVRGFTRESSGGSIPSRLIENRIRLWAYIVTRVTLKIEMTAPAARTIPGQLAPVTCVRIAASPASWPSNCSHGCAPSAETATSR